MHFAKEKQTVILTLNKRSAIIVNCKVSYRETVERSQLKNDTHESKISTAAAVVIHTAGKPGILSVEQ